MTDRLLSHRLTTPGIAVLTLVVVALTAFFGARLVTGGSEPRVLEIPPAADVSGAPTSISLARLYKERIGGVVTIDASFDRTGESSEGTGFLVDGEGYILTSSHVVVDYHSEGLNASHIYVEFAAGDRVPAEFVGRDHFNDIAVLKINPDNVEYTPLPLGDSDRLAVGEPVAAIGAPFGNQATQTSGHVSARRSVASQINRSSRIANAIQTDTAINRGNSGGPLFNARGDVVGINQQINSTSGSNTGVSFAIPINTARRALEQIKDTGTVRWAHLGIRTSNATPQMARQFDLPVTRGALVQEIDAGSPAAGVLRAGTRNELFMGERLVLGDLITSIGGAPVRGKEDVTRLISLLDAGDVVSIELYRDGELRTERVTLAEKPVV